MALAHALGQAGCVGSDNTPLAAADTGPARNAADGRIVDASRSDAAGEHDATTDTDADAMADAAAPFIATGIVAGLPFGPNFVGVQDDVRDPGDGDVAQGVFWEPSAIAIDYFDDQCIGVRTRMQAVVGRDVGTLTVTGASGVAKQALARNAKGYYYLDGSPDAFSIGDAISVANPAHNAGPAVIPSAFKNTNLLGLRRAQRSHALAITATGSSGALVGASLAGNDGLDSYLLLCTSDAKTGRLVVAAKALASFPAAVTSVHFKLEPANAVDGADFRLLAAGPSAATDLPLEP
jgi:hypothetical protein